MDFRYFSGDDNASHRPGHRDNIFQGLANPVRRFVEDFCLRGIANPFQFPTARATLRRQEPSKAE